MTELSPHVKAILAGVLTYNGLFGSPDLHQPHSPLLQWFSSSRRTVSTGSGAGRPSRTFHFSRTRSGGETERQRPAICGTELRHTRRRQSEGRTEMRRIGFRPRFFIIWDLLLTGQLFCRLKNEVCGSSPFIFRKVLYGSGISFRKMSVWVKISFGKMSYICCPTKNGILTSKCIFQFTGALTEQYVLQQFLSDTEYVPYYFSPSEHNEIDFVGYVCIMV